MEEFKDIIELIRKTPSVRPPHDFTQRIVERIASREPVRPSVIKDFLTKSRRFGINPAAAIKGGATREECFLYFMLTGFAHLILASALFWGFRNLNMESQTIIWLKIQPQLVLFLTCWLTVAGSVLMVGRTGLKLSMLASLVYIAIVSFNGFLLIGVVDKPVLRIPVCGLVGATFLVGVFLVLVIQKQLEKKDYDKSICNA